MLDLSAAARGHFEHPRNAGDLNPGDPDVATARVGVPIGGEILRLHLKVDVRDTIVAARFKAYGCGWMIACGSLLTECIEGLTLAEAEHFRHHELVEKLEVPPAKLHCAVLAETALGAALRDYAAKRSPAPAAQTDSQP